MRNQKSIRQLADKNQKSSVNNNKRKKGFNSFKLSINNYLLAINYSWFRQVGFTLIEIVVVMAIIAILAGAIWGNFFTSLHKGRDSRRKQDLDSIAKALELYYNDTKAYPNPTNPLPNWGVPFPHPTYSAVIYMQKLPTDPAYPNSSYCYTSDNFGTYYKLYARLENRNDSEIMVTPVTCGAYSDYNYGISSQNTTP